jgi:hypothetical protein
MDRSCEQQIPYTPFHQGPRHQVLVDEAAETSQVFTYWQLKMPVATF